MKKYIVFSLFALLPLTATATETQHTTTVYLTETLSEEVTQDQLTATLRYVAHGKTAATAQNRLNAAMKQALENIPEAIIVTTGHYQSHEKWDRETETYTGFEASQNVTLTSAESDILLKQTAVLQQRGFQSNALQYTLSKTKENATRDRMIITALTHVQNRARMIAETLGKTTVHIAEVDVSTAGHQVHPLGRNLMMASAEHKSHTAPTAKAGKTPVSLFLKTKVILAE